MIGDKKMWRILLKIAVTEAVIQLLQLSGVETELEAIVEILFLQIELSNKITISNELN